MMKFLKIFTLSSVVAFGIIFIFSKCRKDIVVVPVPIHDTVFGKSITGLAQYLGYNGDTLLAKGAVLSLYSGTSATGSPVATAFADLNGVYSFNYLLPGNYFIWGQYNTDNTNAKSPIKGINFETVPGIAVVLGSADFIQNTFFATVAPAGTLKISIIAGDTSGSMGSIRYAPLESHSKVSFELMHLEDDNNPYATVMGGFNVFKMTDFYFDEANPANTKFRGYVLVSTLNTLEPGRDAVGTCGPKALGVDTFLNGTTPTVLPQSDTAFYYATAGQVEKYGKGYLAHATLEANYKHQGGEIVSPRVTPLTPDTALGYNGPWGVRTANSVDMYFEYQGKKKVFNSTGTTFNWYFEFEGKFTFNRKDFYIKHGLGNEVKVFAHVQLKGVNNVEY